MLQELVWLSVLRRNIQTLFTLIQPCPLNLYRCLPTHTLFVEMFLLRWCLICLQHLSVLLRLIDSWRKAGQEPGNVDRLGRNAIVPISTPIWCPVASVYPASGIQFMNSKIGGSKVIWSSSLDPFLSLPPTLKILQDERGKTISF